MKKGTSIIFSLLIFIIFLNACGKIEYPKLFEIKDITYQDNMLNFNIYMVNVDYNKIDDYFAKVIFCETDNILACGENDYETLINFNFDSKENNYNFVDISNEEQIISTTERSVNIEIKGNVQFILIQIYDRNGIFKAQFEKDIILDVVELGYVFNELSLNIESMLYNEELEQYELYLSLNYVYKLLISDYKIRVKYCNLDASDCDKYKDYYINTDDKGDNIEFNEIDLIQHNFINAEPIIIPFEETTQKIVIEFIDDKLFGADIIESIEQITNNIMKDISFGLDNIMFNEDINMFEINLHLNNMYDYVLEDYYINVKYCNLDESNCTTYNEFSLNDELNEFNIVFDLINSVINSFETLVPFEIPLNANAEKVVFELCTNEGELVKAFDINLANLDLDISLVIQEFGLNEQTDEYEGLIILNNMNDLELTDYFLRVYYCDLDSNDCETYEDFSINQTDSEFNINFELSNSVLGNFISTNQIVIPISETAQKIVIELREKKFLSSDLIDIFEYILGD